MAPSHSGSPHSTRRAYLADQGSEVFIGSCAKRVRTHVARARRRAAIGTRRQETAPQKELAGGTGTTDS